MRHPTKELVFPRILDTTRLFLKYIYITDVDYCPLCIQMVISEYIVEP